MSLLSGHCTIWNYILTREPFKAGSQCPCCPILFSERCYTFFPMTKKEIVLAVSAKLNLTQLQTKEIVQNVFDCLAETLIEEHRIELRNFGVFEVRKRASRTARNPKTGAAVKVKEKYAVAFKSGKALEHTLNEKMKKRKKDQAKP